MDAQFWINAWNEGRTGFHKQTYNDKLLEYFPQLKPQKGQKVLVPLCGKTKDLIWLHDLGLSVHGLELYERPVAEFFEENSLSPAKVEKTGEFIRYSHKDLVISCGDFFKFSEKNAYDLIYDRASLVALPSEMRKTYSKIINESLLPGGKYLLIVYQYDQSKMEGPPFSVGANEIHELYEDHFTISLMESQGPQGENARLAEVGGMKQKVYILEKKG